MERTPSTGGQARQRAAAATRERILAAAAALLAEYGSPKTTIAMVARQAGVAAGTVYLHFPDREALLREVLADALSQLKLALAEVASERAERSAAADVRRRTEGLVAFAANHAELAAVLFHPTHLVTPAGREALEFLVASQAAALTEGQARHWVRPDLEPLLAGRALVGSLLQVLGWWVDRRRSGQIAPDPVDVAAQLANLRLYGTAVRPRE
ncbi:MAG: TetR/AcrR family transcriptional regulator [bacterium]|nr:TetR/AcrR family transcriptional regulator [bacterium]